MKLTNIRYDKIPEHMRHGLFLYLEHGIMPGHFLTAVLCNNLVESFAYADSINTANIRNWADFMYNEMPSPAWGSFEKVKAWSIARREEDEHEADKQA